MQITDAQYVISSVKMKDCPAPNMPEYAFIGRSNVGKSSLINMLTQRKKLAKTSSTPGKTQAINHFLINKSWYIVDLPGIGYAKTSKVNRYNWGKMISNYLLKRENLLTTFVLVDSRHAPQKIDIEFMEWMGMSQLPFVILFTKADKNSKSQLARNIENYKQKLHESWEEIPDYIITSSETKLGQEEILEYIEKTNKLFKE
jgi:GTP-binding protein